jgi:hypothetical protein
MDEIGGHWVEPAHGIVYHGRTDATDGTVWVIPRWHSSAGPHVVVHLDAPDGAVIRRTAVTHAAEAWDLVERVRFQSLRTAVAGIAGIVEPLQPRGRCVLHARSRGNRQYGAASLDAGIATRLCAEFWASPGSHQLRVAFLPDRYEPERLTDVEKMTFELQIEAHATVDLRFGWRWGNPVTLGRPTLHRCKSSRVVDVTHR